MHFQGNRWFPGPSLALKCMLKVMSFRIVAGFEAELQRITSLITGQVSLPRPSPHIEMKLGFFSRLLEMTTDNICGLEEQGCASLFFQIFWRIESREYELGR